MPFALFFFSQGAVDPVRFVAPVPIEKAGLARSPSAVVRAATAAGISQLPQQPVQFRFQCAVGATGRVSNCVKIDARPFGTMAEYQAALEAQANERTEDQGGAKDPLFRAAFDRLQLYGVSKDFSQARKGAFKTVLITESVSSADAMDLGPAAGRLPTGDLIIDTTSLDLSELYPQAALRAGQQRRVTATCRVSPDRSLACRDAHLAGQGFAAAGSMDRDFEIATIAAYALMKAAPQTRSGLNPVGYEAEVSLRWLLP